MQRVQSFGAYDLSERIGVGALGEVFRATCRENGRAVALKRVLRRYCDDADVVEMLRAEAQLARSLDHAAIARFADVGDVGGVPFIAYEYVHGRDLRAVQERGAPIPLDIAIHIALELCRALEHVHGRLDAARRPLGVVHCDVSPTNVLVSFDGGVKLIDFGVATAGGRGAGQVRGTVGYMSPEQVSGGPLDARSDLYALGACLWEMATGRRLFEGRGTSGVLRRSAQGPAPDPRTISDRVPLGLARVILKALAKSPDQRYPTADQFHADLFELAHAEGLLIDLMCVARYLRDLFPEAAAKGAACLEECPNMADNKGGSDLDVFEGLAKKSSRSASPALAPPSTQSRQRTLVGVSGVPTPNPATLPGGLAPPPLPPPAAKGPNSGSMPPPLSLPTGGARPSTLPPVVPPPSRHPPPVPASAPPPAGPPSSLPPAASAGSVTLPPVVPPPVKVPSIKAPAPAPEPAPDKTPEKAAADGAKPRGGKGAAVDMDWDDEEESTHVYDRQTHDSLAGRGTPMPGTTGPVIPKAAAALLANSGGSAAPATKTRTSIPTAPPIPSAPPPPLERTSHAPSRNDEPTAVRARPAVQQGGSKLGVVLGGLACVGLVVLGVLLLVPKKGGLTIDLKAPGGTTIAKAEIFIDGQKRCDTVPCVVRDLDVGTKAIKVIAPEFPPRDAVEIVEGGKEKLVLIAIEPATNAASPTTAASAASSLKASGSQTGVKVSIDGIDKGTLPVELSVPPGLHKVRFDAGERYERLEQAVEIGQGQTKDLGTVSLKVLKGQVTLDLVTSGAVVKLVNAKKVEKKLPEAAWKTPPVKLDVDPSEGWNLIASKKGHDDFKQALSFDDGQAEKTIRIELSESGKAEAVSAAPTPAPAPAPVSAPAPKPEAPAPAPAPKPEAPATPAPAPQAASGAGTLNINSIPVSKVVLDGRPLGSTPKVGVSVPAGSHTVIFIHPELGKKSVTVAVKAGETKTAAVKFK